MKQQELKSKQNSVFFNNIKKIEYCFWLYKLDLLETYTIAVDDLDFYQFNLAKLGGKWANSHI